MPDAVSLLACDLPPKECRKPRSAESYEVRESSFHGLPILVGISTEIIRSGHRALSFWAGSFWAVSLWAGSLLTFRAEVAAYGKYRFLPSIRSHLEIGVTEAPKSAFDGKEVSLVGV